MNYQLAKKLKKSGFENINLYSKSKEVGNAPTLEDLILAINTECFHLEKFEGLGWQASCCINKKGEWEKWHKGRTPVEAVAKLYLNINK